jgi:hypothetical protein
LLRAMRSWDFSSTGWRPAAPKHEGFSIAASRAGLGAYSSMVPPSSLRCCRKNPGPYQIKAPDIVP